MPTSVAGPNCGLLVAVLTLRNYFEPQFLFSLCHPLGETDGCGLCASQFSKSDSHWSDVVHSVPNTSSVYFPYMIHVASGGSVLLVTFADTPEVIEDLKETICFTMLQQTFRLVPISLADIGVDGQMILKIYFLTVQARVQSQAVRVGFGIFQ